MEAHSAITINAAPDAVYAAWEHIERLPEFMYHLHSVTRIDDRRSHWVAKGPAGTEIEWDAEVTEKVSGERISWHSVEGATVENGGTVHFEPAPGGRGTELRVVLTYDPPGGALGAAVGKLFGEEPAQQISDDLRRFKQLFETGEIDRSDGNPAGARTSDAVGQRGAQPLSDDEATERAEVKA